MAEIEMNDLINNMKKRKIKAFCHSKMRRIKMQLSKYGLVQVD